jgi:uncharacterized protein (TIGR02231 family)
MATKKFLVLATLCFGCLLPLHAQKQVSAKLDSVTVFLRGATLYHSANVTLKSGSQEIVIDGLSPDIALNSLKVQANGVLISAMEFEKDYITPKEETAKLKKLSDSLDFYQKQLQEARDELTVHQHLLKMLTDGTLNNMEKKDGTVTVAEINANMELYTSKAKTLQSSINQDNKKIEKLVETVNRLKMQINQDKQDSDVETGVVYLSISVPNNVTTVFNISYYTEDAGWQPHYDINIPGLDKPITMQAKAEVQQETGLDWNNVRLTLSNARPNRTNTVPVFRTWFLRFARNYSADMSDARSNRASNYVSSSNVSAALSSCEGVTATDGTNKKVVSTRMEDYISIDEQDVHVNYKIAVPYNIPGNGNEQLVDLVNYNLEAEYNYYCAPKLSNETYLIATLSGLEKYNLLSGYATVTFNNTFVGETYLNPNSTQDKVTLTLATDPRVTVKRELQRDYSSTKHVGSTTTETRSYLITVRNNQNRNAKLTLKEQYPISNDKDIEVKLVEMKPTATYNKEDIGVLTWELDLSSGETRTFVVTYSVKYPKDRTLAW